MSRRNLTESKVYSGVLQMLIIPNAEPIEMNWQVSEDQSSRLIR